MKILRSPLSPARVLPAVLALLSFAQLAGANPVITNVVELNGDNEATDTIVAQWTGHVFTNGIAGEPRPGHPAADGYTGEVFTATVPCYVDRAHCYTNAAGNVPIPPYLLGAEYILSGNDNRDNALYTLDVFVTVPVRVYMLVDNRLSDANAANPPTFDATHMQWMLDEGWTPVRTGVNRTFDATLPDEVGIDESADGTINNWFSVYTKAFPAGTFRLKQADNTGNNMYGAVVVPLRELPQVVQIGANKVGSVTFNSSTGASYSVVAGGNDIWDARDEFIYAYREMTGDFDVQVRLESLQLGANWTKGGLMARETLSEFSRMAFQRATPSSGANDIHLAYRDGRDRGLDPNNNNAPIEGESGGQHEAGSGAPSYPNTWLRLIRAGNVLTGQSSSDGVTWTATASQDTATWAGGALPNTLFLGLATSRHSGPNSIQAEYRDLGFNYGAPFVVAGASSRGNQNGVRVNFSRPPGVGGLTPANYTLTAVGGPKVTVVTGLRFTSANDAPERDPMTFTLEGTTGNPAGGAWTLIATGNTGLGTARNTTAPDVTFANAASYSSYRLVFPTVRDTPTSANSMQIAEVAFLDAGLNDVTAPGDALIPTSSNSPGNEGVVRVIDNDNGTKYLNFDKLNTGFVVTPSGGATATGATVLSAAQGPNLTMVQLTTSTLIEGATYTVTVANVLDGGGGGLGVNAASFVHGAGFEQRRIVVTHNKFSDSGYYPGSDAIAKGIGDVVQTGDIPAGRPGVESNTVFEDPIPDTGGNERFGSRVAGLLTIATNGNYTFYMSSDDIGFTYLSTDENPANKQQICREPNWNGRREYITGGNQGTRGSPAANISAAIALQAGKKYYFETIFNEGGGGNNGSATWLPPGGAPVANGSSPIPEAFFFPVRMVNGTVFNSLGPVQITVQPTNTIVLALTPVTFVMKLEGTPAYQIQWRRNGQPIPGATGSSYTIPVTQLSDDQAVFSATAANEFSSVTSSNAVLTVLSPQPPHLLGAVGSAGLRNVTVNFDNRLDPATGTNIANYSIPGLTISIAALDSTGKGVVLTTSLQTEGASYTVTVSNVRDLTGTTVMSPNPSMANFTAWLFCTGFAVMEVYRPESTSDNNIQTTLLADPNFPNNPNERFIVTSYDSRQAYPNDTHEGYGARISGYFVPPVTDNYIFYIRSDDSSRLYINPTGADPAGKVLIDEETGCCNPFSSHASANQSLTAGVRYYLELIYKEGTGGDFGQVAVKQASDPTDPNALPTIPASMIGQLFNPDVAPTVTLTQQPTSTVVRANSIVTFSAAATRNPAGPLSFQWRRNGVDIPLANQSSYTIGPVSLADSGALFSVLVCAPGRSVASTNAMLTVYVDTNSPVVVSARGSTTFNKVTVVFDELVDLGTSQDTFNYAIVPNLNVSTSVRNPDGMSVTLTTDPQTENTLYTVSVTGVADLAGNAIPIDQPQMAVFRAFVAACPSVNFVKFEAYDTASTAGTAINLLTNHPNYPNNPRDVAFIQNLYSRLAYPNDSHEQYGGRMRGLFFPRESGNHFFFLAADDNAELWLSTDASPTHKVRIASESAWSADREWTTSSGGSTVANKKSPAINLQAGQPYYIEALWKEGGGGDHCAAAVQSPSDAGAPANGSGEISAASLGAVAPPDILGPINFVIQPAPQMVFENAIVTFSVRATVGVDFATVSYQWQRDSGMGFQDIPGAVGTNYVIPQVLLSDNGAKFRALVCVIGARTPSDMALLSVAPDHTPPHVVSCSGSDSMDKFTLVFDEPIDAATAADAFNFEIASAGGPLSVTGTMLSADGRTLMILTARQGENIDYTITINNLTDRASMPNPIAPNTHVVCRSFVLSCGFLTRQFYYNIAAPPNAVSSLTSDPRYPFNPSAQDYFGQYAVNPALGDTGRENYGARVAGLLVPKETGDYTFKLLSDDGGQVWVSTDINAANKVSIIAADGDCGGCSGPVSGPVALVAGQMYWTEAIFEEGTGGDYMVITWAPPSAPTTYVPIAGSSIAAYASGVGASITITQQPVSQEFCQVSGGAQVFVTFNSGGTASITGNANQPIFYQWQRNNGAGYVDIPGANGPSYTLAAVLADNGACFRLTLYIPGLSTNSQPACLSVKHKNTAPEFICGPNVLPQDCGPQSLQWATGIAPDSIHGASVTFSNGFSGGTPAGTALYGNASISGGILHLTDALNDQQGSFIVNDLLGGLPLTAFNISFKALLGQGTATPADGFSVCMANDLPNGVFGEEGVGTGLRVSFDSYNNDAVDDAPAIDVFQGGVRIAHTHVPSLDTGGQFAPVSIVLHENGTLDVTAAGNPIYVGLPTGYTPISGVRFGLGGRTGNLNENNWIDDLSITATAADDSASEANQHVTFMVSNDNNALFSVQPAISPSGVLTYTPAVHAGGVATVNVVAQDDGGTDCNGTNASASCNFTITLNCTLAARDDGAATAQGQPVSIPLSKLLRNDGVPAGNLTTPFGTITVTGVHPNSTNGTVVLGSTNVTYTPQPGFSGVDRFTYIIGDGNGIGSAQVEILVVNGSLPGQNQVALIPNANGILVRFAGIPGRSYQLQRAPTVTGPWTTINTQNAPAHGIMEYQDNNPSQPNAFYRTLAVGP